LDLLEIEESKIDGFNGKLYDFGLIILPLSTPEGDLISVPEILNVDIRVSGVRIIGLIEVFLHF
jgi:hypothetical protein